MGWRRSHHEVHLSYRSNWLRAAVLGANDGILSVSSLLLGVAASGASRVAILTAGLAGLVAGALLDGRRRVRVGQLTARHRVGRPAPGGARAGRGSCRRAARADRHLSPPWTVSRPLLRKSPLRSRTPERWRPTPATSWASTSNDGRGRCKLPARRLSPSPAAPCCRWWRSRRPVTNIGCSPVLLSRSLRSPASATPVLVWAEHPESEPPFASWCGGRWQWQ